MLRQEPHGVKGHINIYQLDTDSDITAFGKHDRVVVFLPDYEGLYCRVDHLHGLGTPSEKEILKVAKAWPNEIKGRWKLARAIQHDDGRATDYFFERDVKNA